jgi:hypothetical protein
VRSRRAAVLVLGAVLVAACGGAGRDAAVVGPPPVVTAPTSTRPATTVPLAPATTDTTIGRPAAPALPVPSGPPPTYPPATYPPVTAPSLVRAPGAPAAHGAVQQGAPPAADAPPTYLRTPMGCADGTDAASLDRFFAERRGAAVGWDYPHVQALGDGRAVWLFQDAFLDPGGTATGLADSHLVRNVAVLQDGLCFTLVQGGSAGQPEAFESGVGEIFGVRWWWPVGTQTRGDELDVVWVEMVGDAVFPRDGIGLPWFPAATWIGTYRTSDLTRLSFVHAPDPRVDPIYGYAVAAEGKYTYLFGNTYQQDLLREGGLFVEHTAISMYVARVPKGRLDAKPTYWDGARWTADRSKAVPISKRFGFENPMQPRFIDGRWIAVTKVDGFLGDSLVVDVAPAPQGPWVEVSRVAAPARRDDPALATYHAYLMPWRSPSGGLVVSLSQNAGDAQWAPAPEAWMYRPAFFELPWPPTEPPPTTVAETTTTAPTEPTSTEAPTSEAPPTSEPSTSAESTSEPPTTASVPGGGSTTSVLGVSPG